MINHKFLVTAAECGCQDMISDIFAGAEDGYTEVGIQSTSMYLEQRHISAPVSGSGIIVGESKENSGYRQGRLFLIGARLGTCSDRQGSSLLGKTCSYSLNQLCQAGSAADMT